MIIVRAVNVPVEIQSLATMEMPAPRTVVIQSWDAKTTTIRMDVMMGIPARQEIPVSGAAVRAVSLQIVMMEYHAQ